MLQDLGKISFGSLLVALGTAYILRNSFLVSSFFWTFLASFLVLYGFLTSVYNFIKKNKKEEIQNLFLLFLGVSILIIQLGIINYTNFIMFALALGSLGLASLISGSFLSYSLRNIFAGIIMLGVSLIFFLPPVMRLSDKAQLIIKQFGIGILLILVGIVIFLPSKKKEE